MWNVKENRWHDWVPRKFQGLKPEYLLWYNHADPTMSALSREVVYWQQELPPPSPNHRRMEFNSLREMNKAYNFYSQFHN